MIFVVILAVLAHGLAEHITASTFTSFALQFMAVFWVWNAFTYYTERFESDGLENRLFTFIAILSVAGMAVWGDDGLGHNYGGFAASYLLARALNIGMWIRAAYHEPVFRPVAARFAGGFTLAVAAVTFSFMADDGARLVLWAVTANERSGVGAGTVVQAALGLGIGFGLWWIYFDFVARRPTRPLFTAALGWVYLHLLTLTAIVTIGVAVGDALIAGDGGPLPQDLRTLLLSSVAAALLFIALLELTLDRQPGEPTQRLSPALKVAPAAVLVIVTALGLPFTTVTAFAAALFALAVPAVYGAIITVHSRQHA